MSPVAALVDRLTAIQGKLADRANPLLVKEARQALKGRLFLLSTMLLLGAGSLVAVVAASGATMTSRSNAGAAGLDVFPWYLGFLAVAVLGVIPFTAFGALTQEIRDRTFELLAITAMSPGRILRGKLAAALVQVWLYVSVLAPFLVFTYFLGGIDILTILFFLALAALASVFLVVFSLLVATLTARRAVSRQSGRAILAMGLFWAAWGGIFASYEILRFNGLQEYFNHFLDTEVLLGTSTFLFLYATYGALFYALGRAALTFESANRSTAVRAVLFVQWAGWSVLMWLIWREIRAHGRGAGDVNELLLVYAIPVVIQWFLAGAFLSSEPDVLSARVEAERARLGSGRFGRLRKALSALFYPGGTRGLRLTAFVLLSTLLLAEGIRADALSASSGWSAWQTQWLERARLVILLLVMYALSYLALPIGILRLLRIRCTPRAARITILLTFVAGMLLPVLVLLFSRSPGESDEWSPWILTNPVWTMILVAGEKADPAEAFRLVGGAAAVSILLVALLPSRIRPAHVPDGGSAPSDG